MINHYFWAVDCLANMYPPRIIVTNEYKKDIFKSSEAVRSLRISTTMNLRVRVVNPEGVAYIATP